jgi:hypothetical protein
MIAVKGRVTLRHTQVVSHGTAQAVTRRASAIIAIAVVHKVQERSLPRLSVVWTYNSSKLV